MNPPAQISRRSRILRWLLVGVGLCLVPFAVLALVVASYLTLDRNAAVLRREVMVATNLSWNTKVQLSLGQATINAVNYGLSFARDRDVADARAALTAISRASVGVYERSAGNLNWSRERLFSSTDRAMQRRGWMRLVGVIDAKDTVLIYVPEDTTAGDVVEVCLAVLTGRELVVVSTRVNGDVLADLVKIHAPDEVKTRLRLAGLALRS